MTHARQNDIDRSIGDEWERAFEEMARSFRLECRKPDLSIFPPEARPEPDRVVIRNGSVEWHEIKHKRPTRAGSYGLEGYRFAALLRLEDRAGEPVLYTIHDWRVAGAETSAEHVANSVDDWFTVDVADLGREHAQQHRGDTYYGGRTASTTILFWPTYLWAPLAWRWGIPDHADKRKRAAVSVVPCATCGALPVGLMHHTAEQLARLGPDHFRRYDCGPHPPLRVGQTALWEP